MTLEDYYDFWGKGRLKLWPAECLLNLKMDGPSKGFLHTVGLPFESGMGMQQRHGPINGGLPRLPGFDHYHIIGYDDPVPVCIDESDGGSVVSVQNEETGYGAYTNISVVRYAQSLTIYGVFRMNEYYRPNRDDEDPGKLEKQRRKDALRKLKRDLKDADATAFNDEDSFWPQILEQMKLGMM